MDNESITLLYLKHIINPLEKIIKSPDFIKNYSYNEQQIINQFLLKQYCNLESLMKEKKDL